MWSNYKDAARKVPYLPYMKKMYEVLQKNVSFLEDKRHWDKLRPEALLRLDRELKKDNSDPLVMIEWSDEISYNSLLLTDKSIFRVLSEKNKIVLSRKDASRKILKDFKNNQKYYTKYLGQISKGGTHLVFYFVTVWEDNRIANTFVFLSLDRLSSFSGDEKKISSLYNDLHLFFVYKKKPE